jgi:hypothetical protein
VLMERPFFALNKSRRTAIDYRSRDGSIRIGVEPGPRGMAEPLFRYEALQAHYPQPRAAAERSARFRG